VLVKPSDNRIRRNAGRYVSMVIIGIVDVSPARAIDGGLTLQDGYPLLGNSKTWRGLIAAIVLSTCASVLVGLQWQTGALAGAFAMLGDCLSSLIKRRLGVGPGDMCLGGSIRFLNPFCPRWPAAYTCRSALSTSLLLCCFSSSASSSFRVYPSGLACVTDLIDWRPSRVGAV